MFNKILAVTICVSDLQATELAYGSHLGYDVVERSTISTAMAAAWSAPNMVGRNYLCMRPASGAEFYLRFVQAKPVPGYAAMRTRGWNAIELLVEDTDAMAERLRHSAFRIIGEPRDLSSDGNVRAMQTLAPGGEVVYLTRIQGAREQVYGSAQSMVDRAFILVVGSDDFPGLVEFYGKRLGHTLQTFGRTTISVVSNALEVSQDTLYDMKLARLGNHFSIEMDGYPMQIPERPRHDGELPPGIAMVTMAVAAMEDVTQTWHGKPTAIDESFYQGKTASVLTGAAGEWLEIVGT